MIDVHPQNLTVSGALPLDRPYSERPHRLYVATTNNCNRACPWCSTCSSPRGGTWITPETYAASFPQTGPFEVQLEGGEPTIHPDFGRLVELARANARCTRVVVVTNGVVLPRSMDGLRSWCEALGEPLTIKLSVNHHLLERDGGLLELAKLLRDVLGERFGDRQLVLNVRLRRGTPDDDRFVTDAIEKAELSSLANVFYLQRYGFGTRYKEWEEPFIVGENFTMVNPDGTLFGPDLVARSEAMRAMGARR